MSSIILIIIEIKNRLSSFSYMGWGVIRLGLRVSLFTPPHVNNFNLKLNFNIID